MEKLDEGVLSKILSYVPIEFVSRCKLVCRSWERLLSRSRDGGLLFSIATRGQRNAKLYYADYYDLMSIDNPHRDEPNYRFKTRAAEIDHPPINKIKKGHNRMGVAVGSHNGLVCFSVPHHGGLKDPVYICNPRTREYVNLPRFDSRKGGYIVSGFGYLPSTNEYKVVRICYPFEKRDNPRCSAVGWAQVYTLGKNNNNHGGWRDVGEITNTLWLPGVQANGALHFMDDVEWKIMAFDLEAEEFGMLPPLPSCFEKASNSTFQVQVLGEQLYVVHQRHDERVDIWSFRHSQNRNRYEPGEKDYASWSWSKNFSIEWQDITMNDSYRPFSITERNEFLFWVGNSNLCCYDQETGDFKKIVNMNEDTRLVIFQGIPYKSSLVSLKELGVRSKIRPRRKTAEG